MRAAPGGDAVVEIASNMPLIGMRVCDADRRAGKMGICDYVGYSEATVLSWIRSMNFPARKLGGKWVSTTGEAYRFLQDYISGKSTL
jgi:hypothetical protein